MHTVFTHSPGDWRRPTIGRYGTVGDIVQWSWFSLTLPVSLCWIISMLLVQFCTIASAASVIIFFLKIARCLTVEASSDLDVIAYG